MPLDFYFFLEVFGYIGSALVIISMLMTSVVKLRIINICGGAISTIYAFFGGAFPIVLMNTTLIIINIVQLIRLRHNKPAFGRVYTKAGDKTAEYFLSLYEEDIKKYYPEYTVPTDENCHIHMAYVGNEAVGAIIGERMGDTMHITLDYSIPKYRDLSVSGFLFERLKEDGVRTLCAPIGVEEHKKYLIRMGFSEDGGHMTKTLGGTI